jgi:hypothetical protein
LPVVDDPTMVRRRFLFRIYTGAKRDRMQWGHGEAPPLRDEDAADAQVLGRMPEAMAVVQAAIDAGQTGAGVTDSDPNWQPDFLGTLKRLLGVT